MTTPTSSPDPFATPTGAATPPPPGAEFAATPAYAPPAYSPISVGTDNSLSKVALWATILTAGYTLVTLASAVFAASDVEALKEALTNPEDASPFAGVSVVSMLAFPVMIGSYVLLALWMSKVRGARVARGERVGGPPAVEWWGWFVPLASAVLPFLGMRAITKPRTRLGVLLGWWLAYIASGLVAASASIVQFGAMDFTTGKLTDPDALDAMVPITWASAVLLVISWVFLALTIRSTTAAEKAA